MLLRQLNFGALSAWQLFYVYYKEKLHFSLICSFYCLVKGGWTLNVSKQFPILGLVTYKLVVYQKSKCIAHYCIVIILKIEKKHTADILYVNLKFQIFYFLCCKVVLSRESGNEGLSSVAREMLVSLLILHFYNVFKLNEKIKMQLLLKGNFRKQFKVTL